MLASFHSHHAILGPFETRVVRAWRRAPAPATLPASAGLAGAGALDPAADAAEDGDQRRLVSLRDRVEHPAGDRLDAPGVLAECQRPCRRRLELDRAPITTAAHAAHPAFILHPVDEPRHRADWHAELAAERARDHRPLGEQGAQERELALRDLEAAREERIGRLEAIRQEL